MIPQKRLVPTQSILFRVTFSWEVPGGIQETRLPRVCWGFTILPPGMIIIIAGVLSSVRAATSLGRIGVPQRGDGAGKAARPRPKHIVSQYGPAHL